MRQVGGAEVAEGVSKTKGDAQGFKDDLEARSQPYFQLFSVLKSNGGIYSTMRGVSP
jgi:hypothetical protein